ncbi:hypothetical protein RB595_002188 [Gaeumannomyces hyphopodioides]
MAQHPLLRLARAIARRPQLRLRHRPRPQQCNSSSTTKKPLKEDPIPVPSTVPPVPVAAWWQRLGPLSRAASAYGRAQRRRPHATQLCTSLAIYLAADLSAQRMAGGGGADGEVEAAYDPARTARSLVIGGLASIPGYKWFMFLSHNFNYRSRLASLAVKIAVNQSFFTPLFNTYFFGMHSLLSGDSLRQVADRICLTVPTSVVNSLKLWPAVTAFSFTFLPPEYRSAFAGVVAVGWQTYLAFLNRKAELLAHEETAAAATAASGVGERQGTARAPTSAMAVTASAPR